MLLLSTSPSSLLKSFQIKLYQKKLFLFKCILNIIKDGPAKKISVKTFEIEKLKIYTFTRDFEDLFSLRN